MNESTEIGEHYQGYIIDYVHDLGICYIRNKDRDAVSGVRIRVNPTCERIIAEAKRWVDGQKCCRK